ncbi:MAG: hypothetical protein OEW58_02815 [Gammaproteobacteria bacterium]|nr:hypothetical protein [Gammaproteobacteria bacterium]
MKKWVLLLCILMLPVTSAQAKKNPWNVGQPRHVELEYRQGSTMGVSSVFSGINLLFNTGWVKGGTVSIGVLNQPIERTSHGVTQRVQQFAYGGPRFKLDYRLGSRTTAEVFAVVGVGSIDYREQDGLRQQRTNGMVAVMHSGVRSYWQVDSLALGLGISGMSVSVGDGLDGGPYADLVVRYYW